MSCAVAAVVGKTIEEHVDCLEGQRAHSFVHPVVVEAAPIALGSIVVQDTIVVGREPSDPEVIELIEADLHIGSCQWS